MSTIWCVLQCGKPCNEATESITSLISWETIRNKALLWSGLDTFGDVYTSVDWDKGPSGHAVHKNCITIISTARRLKQAKNRQKKREVEENQNQSSSRSESSSLTASVVTAPLVTPSSVLPATLSTAQSSISYSAPHATSLTEPDAKRRRSSVEGPIHDKTKCIWYLR